MSVNNLEYRPTSLQERVMIMRTMKDNARHSSTDTDTSRYGPADGNFGPFQ